MNKAMVMARWIISLRHQGYPYNDEDTEDTLAKKIFKEELRRQNEGLPSLFERKGVIPDKSLPEDENSSEENLYDD
jgi:hypothetical protein